jgi:DNA-binding NarL/FixJ family response regulator
MGDKIRVYIASQQSLFQQGIKHSLMEMPDIEVQGVGGITPDVLAEIDTTPPDVALVDIDGPSDEGLNLARKIRQRSPNIAVVVMTSSPNDSQLFQSQDPGSRLHGQGCDCRAAGRDGEAGIARRAPH